MSIHEKKRMTMNILKSLFPLKSLAAPARIVGSTITARIIVETPAPIHGIGLELHYSAGLTYGGSTTWGNLFAASNSDDVANEVDGHLYIERAIGPGDTPDPAGSYVVCEVPFIGSAVGMSEVSIANLIATRYSGDAIEQLETEAGAPAQVEVVMQQTAAKVVVRVEWI